MNKFILLALIFYQCSLSARDYSHSNSTVDEIADGIDYSESDNGLDENSTELQLPVPPPSRNPLELAREALEAEVANGKLPREAIEPLLKRIAPVIERVSSEMENPNWDANKMDQVLASSPDLKILRNGDGSSLQVIAQIMGPEDNPIEPSTEQKRPVSETMAFREPASEPIGLKNSTLKVTKESSSNPASMSSTPSKIFYVLKSPLVAPNSNGFTTPPVKEGNDEPSSKTKRPLAVNAKEAKGGAVDGALSLGNWGGGTDLERTQSITGNSKITLNPSKVAAGKSMLKSAVQKLISAFLTQEETKVQFTDLASSEKSGTIGFSLLKFPKLSATRAFRNLSSEVWSERQSYYQKQSYKIPFWLDLLLMLSAFSVSVLFVWLVWRRRYWSRRVIHIESPSIKK